MPILSLIKKMWKVVFLACVQSLAQRSTSWSAGTGTLLDSVLWSCLSLSHCSISSIQPFYLSILYDSKALRLPVSLSRCTAHLNVAVTIPASVPSHFYLYLAYHRLSSLVSSCFQGRARTLSESFSDLWYIVSRLSSTFTCICLSVAPYTVPSIRSIVSQYQSYRGCVLRFSHPPIFNHFASMNKLPYTQRTLRADKVDVTLWEM